jgi:Tol biopolymer transport system component/DNA-binding winged helix-turn-helix (wHTH) protein
MELQSRPRRVVQFGGFKADLDSGELFKDGLKVRLPEQPFRLLAILLECPGEVVSRDELRRRLWPEDTHVDFDRSLNTAASKLREALGDAADNVETLPKRGYRFVAPVNGAPHAAAGTSETGDQPVRNLAPFRRYFLWLAVLAVAAFAFGFAYLRWFAPTSFPSITRSVRLTNDDFSKSPELVSDGPRVYFSAWKGGRGVLAQVSTASGDTERMPTPSIGTSACVRGISPDGQTLLVVTGKQRRTLAGYPLWTVGTSTLASRRVGELVANDAAWSPDGRQIAYATQNQIWLAETDGTKARKVAEQGGLTGYPRWSPDGQRIRFTTLAWDTYEQTIWEVSVRGGAVRPLFPGWHAEQWGGQWTPDGTYYVFNSESNLWAVRDRTSWLRKISTRVQLTFGPLSYLAPLPGPDGKRLYAVGEVRRGELLHYDVERGELVSLLPGLSADSLSFSHDGEWITYVSYPNVELWRSRSDGRGRQLLVAAPMKVDAPRWSPDDQQIVFNGKVPGDVWKAYLIGANGGAPKEVAPSRLVKDADWSPDGARLIVTSEHQQKDSIASLELQTGKLSPVPGSDDLDGPRWSPDGRYISASRGADFACMLFDASSQSWSEIALTSCWWANWTRDSRSFFSLEGKGESIRRFDVTTRKFEGVVSLRDYRITGNHLAWLGITPDDSPVILKDAGSQEIYALDWQTR